MFFNEKYFKKAQLQDKNKIKLGVENEIVLRLIQLSKWIYFLII